MARPEFMLSMADIRDTSQRLVSHAYARGMPSELKENNFINFNDLVEIVVERWRGWWGWYCCRYATVLYVELRSSFTYRCYPHQLECNIL